MARGGEDIAPELEELPDLIEPGGQKIWLDPSGIAAKELLPDGSLYYYLPVRVGEGGSFTHIFCARSDGPACIRSDGFVFWIDAESFCLHREEGYAVEYPGGGGERWRDGVLQSIDQAPVVFSDIYDSKGAPITVGSRIYMPSTAEMDSGYNTGTVMNITEDTDIDRIVFRVEIMLDGQKSLRILYTRNTRDKHTLEERHTLEELYLIEPGIQGTILAAGGLEGQK